MKADSGSKRMKKMQMNLSVIYKKNGERDDSTIWNRQDLSVDSDSKLDTAKTSTTAMRITDEAHEKPRNVSLY